MPRNGSGTYSLPAGNPVVTGTTISSTTHNTTMSDVATALTGSLAKDGQTTPTNNLPMGTYKHTGVGAATNLTDYARADQAQNSSFVWCGTAGGTANAITLTPNPSIAAYAAGQTFRFKSGANANTSTVTFAISGLSAIDGQVNGAACSGGEIAANQWYQITLSDTSTAQITKLGRVLLSEIGAPTLVSLEGLSLASGDILYAPAADTLQRLAKGTDGQILALSSGVPNWIDQQKASGDTVQVVSSFTSAAATGSTTIPKDDTIPQNTEGTQFLSKEITPVSGSNYLEVRVNLMVSNSAGGGYLILALFRDSGADAVAVTSQGFDTGTKAMTISLIYYVLAGSTSPTTFKVRVGCEGAGTTTLNGSAGSRLFGGSAASGIVITEIKA